ncbi:MAG: hypothetical protein J5836_03690, partial [Clostridia bacterium]|nr:hypothetical protein [Clostridia bacterium]
MKKLISVITALVMLFLIPGTAVFAEADNSSIPADVLAYAQGEGMASMKSFMKYPSNGYIGEVVSSAEEIDALTLGQGYALSCFELNDHPTLAACAKPADEWLFSLDNENGAVVYFGVIREEGGLSHFGAIDAKNLSAALGVIRRLSENEGAEFAPVIHQDMTGFVVAQSFGGGDKVITVPGSAFPLDGSYLAVTRSEELPTFEEYTDALRAKFKPLNTDEFGKITFDVKYGDDPIELLPHAAAAAANAAEPGSKAAGKSWLVPAVACSAALLVLA